MARKIASIDETTKALTPEVVAANSGTTAQTFAGGADTRITGAAQRSANLSDLANAATARTNLGLGTAATTDATAYATAAQGELADATTVQQVTLTGPLAYTMPVSVPAGIVHRVTFTQDGSGGHTVTFDGQPLDIDTTSNASTAVELWPHAGGHRVVYPGGPRVQQIDLRSFLTPGEKLPDDGVLDASPLIRRAVDAVSASAATEGPRAILVPPGRYRIASTIVWKTGAGLIGAGRGNTTFMPEGTAVLAASGTMDWQGATIDDCVFADFTIDCRGQSADPTNNGVKAVAIRWLNRARFERVTAIGSWATAFGCDFMQDSSFVDCVSIGSGRGVNTSRWGVGAGFGIGVGRFEVESVRMVNCSAIDSYSAGFFIERLALIDTPSDARGVEIIACLARGNHVGVQDAGAHGMRVADCTLIENDLAGFATRGSSQLLGPRHGGHDGVLDSCTIERNGGLEGSAGVLMAYAGGGGYTVNDCTITDNDGPGVWAPSTSRLGPVHRIIGSRIERNTGAGVIYESLIVDRLEVSGCTIRDNGTAGVVVASDNTGLRIVHNRIAGHAGPGVALRGALKVSLSPTITGNDLRDNTGGGVINETTTTDATGITGNLASDPVATITNYIPNPSLETATTGYGNPTNMGTLALVSGGASAGAQFLRGVASAASAAMLVRTPPVQVQAGDVWTFSAMVRALPNRLIVPRILWSGNSWFTYWYGGETRGTGDWVRISITAPVPTGASGGPTAAQLVINIESPGVEVGDTLDVDAVMATKGSTLWPYFDGDTAGAAWSGTAHASTSVLTL